MFITWWTYDFGYSWPFTAGHLLVMVGAVSLAVLGWWRQWSTWTTVAGIGLAIWGMAGAVIMHTAIQINEPASLPTDAFLSQGTGRVLELGAGSGRGTVGLLLARPRATVTAVDLYTGYYGIDDNSPARLQRNAAVAGVQDRVDIKTADMRKLPFGAGEFDAAMSIAAIDHLRWADIDQSLRETARVLKPGGQLLIVSLNPDVWVRIAIPTSLHGGFWGQAQNASRWNEALARAGFDVTETGSRAATYYVLAARR